MLNNQAFFHCSQVQENPMIVLCAVFLLGLGKLILLLDPLQVKYTVIVR
jgi:hypothetical protein